MNSEFSNLLADLKEHILYMQELGVENFNVDLPEFNSSKFDIKKPSPESAPMKFVPDKDFLISRAEKTPKIERRETQPLRRSFLEQTKLSNLSSPSKIEPASEPIREHLNKDDHQLNKKEMPKITEETPQDLLFENVTQTLPESNETIEDIRADIGDCTRCPLWQGRTKIVHSTGNLKADLMFVGEAPGADEDAQGLPFVGRAGQLLSKIIEAIGMKREDVFIGNINRCRPPGNRTPTLEEARTCKPFLLREIAVVRPKIIVVLGNTACQNLLETKVGITKIRGEFQDYFGVKVMPTFHPAYLLRDPSKKREVWEDLKKVREELSKLK